MHGRERIRATGDRMEDRLDHVSELATRMMINRTPSTEGGFALPLSRGSGRSFKVENPLSGIIIQCLRHGELRLGVSDEDRGKKRKQS